MQIDNTKYEINKIGINWTVPLNKVRTLLSGFEQLKPYQHSWNTPSMRCRCHEIFGLKTTEVEISAPFEDRPPLQVMFEVAPIKAGFLEKLHTPYFKQLKKVLGHPNKSKNEYKPLWVSKAYISSSVIFSASWILGDVRVDLSVYGGTRNESSGDCAAGIYVDWINEIKGAGLFRKENELIEKSMATYLSNEIPIIKFKLNNKQVPFTVTHYELADPYIVRKNNEIRRAQKALYNRYLYETPVIIGAQLDENEIAYYHIPEMNSAFISTQWDTIRIVTNGNNDLTFYEILPARGSGERTLVSERFTIHDSRTSDALPRLIKKIENDLGISIERKEGLDD